MNEDNKCDPNLWLDKFITIVKKVWKCGSGNLLLIEGEMKGHQKIKFTSSMMITLYFF